MYHLREFLFFIFYLPNLSLNLNDDDENLKEALKKTFNNTDFILSCNHIRKNKVKSLSLPNVIE
ncbi:hypothetical protein BpHYR1_029196 [Brachionus plicatilis]|uniref:Uncharacterized protein n=1 Tax=Brachionus plicatilis TaxID=10195 RepID=A0A3M7Q6S0_BRAPC|nr:hypothetical protein BpHYR1_029196 [Brachionus plicatilis]